MKFKFLVVLTITLPLNSFQAFSQVPVRFACVGDYPTGASVQSVANLVASWNPDFIFTVGDNNYTPNNPSVASWDNEVGQYYGAFIKYPAGSTSAYSPGPPTNRFFPALGNHDWDADIAGWYNYFDLPGNERYFEVVKGPVHLYFIDSDSREPDGCTSTSVQGQWLQSRLANSGSPWKIVVFHHPPYSSSTAHGNTPYMQWPFAEWGATLVVNGHDHVYERIVKSEFNYVVNGLGGAPLYVFNATPEPGSVVRYSDNYGAMLFTATTQTLIVKAYSITHELIDSLGFAASSLPVTLSSFAGTVLSNNRVRLNWTTLGELNNYGFEVQRRVQATDEFLTIHNSFVPGHGTTISPHAYAFTDFNPPSGRLEYRLKQIDLDGEIHFIDPISLSTITSAPPSVGVHFHLYQNYPNPFNPATTIRYSLERTAQVRLALFDGLGKEVALLIVAEQEQGVHEIQLATCDLSSGTYFYRLESSGFSETKRLLIMK
jgi:hypothetical protein